MSFDDPTDDELRLLSALTGVCGQYMPGSATYLDHEHMSTGEHAVDVLEKYGLLIPDGRGGSWTAKANAVSRLDDINLSNIETVRSEFLASSAKEPLEPRPGERHYQHDVALDHLSLWFPSRANAKDKSKPRFGRFTSPNRLDVEARLSPVDAMSVIRGEILTIAEVSSFRDQLARMLERSSGQAKLIAYKGSLEIRVKVDGEGMLRGEITLRNPNFNHSLSSRFSGHSISTLTHTVAGFDRVLSKFPQIEDGN